MARRGLLALGPLLGAVATGAVLYGLDVGGGAVPGVLSVPLLATGIALMFAPSTSSFFAYSHLVSAAWCTGLLVWHLRRYVGASLRAAFGTQQAQSSASTAPRVVSPR